MSRYGKFTEHGMPPVFCQMKKKKKLSLVHCGSAVCFIIVTRNVLLKNHISFSPFQHLHIFVGESSHSFVSTVCQMSFDVFMFSLVIFFIGLYRPFFSSTTLFFLRCCNFFFSHELQTPTKYSLLQECCQ